MVKGYIYRHWLINDKNKEKNYVGKTIQLNINNRWRNGDGYIKNNPNTKFARAIRKYGWDAFNHEVVLTIECETKEELDFWLKEWEKYYIEKYDSYYNGYNSTLGGDGTFGYGRTEERKEKQSKKMVGKYKDENQPLYGTHHSDKTKKKIGNSNKGRTPSEKQKNKMKKLMEGKNNPRAKKVICLNTLDIFQTIEDCKKWCGLKSSGIAMCCRGERETSGKHPINGERLYWMYYDEWNKLDDKTKIEKIKQIQPTFSKEGDKNPNSKKIICLETKQVFQCIKDAEEWCGVKRSISSHITGKTKSAGKHPITGEKLHWMYYEDYLKLQEKNSNNNKVA